jgi:hypothetical protein
MIHPETHEVTEDRGPRPAGPPDECFYCLQPVGERHKGDCIIRERTVVLRMTVELVVRVPEEWDHDMIEFHRNESSWCSGNVVSELKRKECLCRETKFQYLREATQEEDEEWGLTHLDPL